MVPWSSTGWTNNKNITKMLELMELSGDVAIAGRRGRERLWDLAERVYPDEPIVPAEDAMRRRNQKRLHALGLARARAQETRWSRWPLPRSESRPWSRAPRDVATRPFLPRATVLGPAALLSPFDRLVHDRKRARELFEFDYQLEMYKPARSADGATTHCRSCTATGWSGSSTRPPIGRGRLARRRRSMPDVSFTEAMSSAIDKEIADLARWLELELVLPTS